MRNLRKKRAGAEDYRYDVCLSFAGGDRRQPFESVAETVVVGDLQGGRRLCVERAQKGDGHRVLLKRFELLQVVLVEVVPKIDGPLATWQRRGEFAVLKPVVQLIRFPCDPFMVAAHEVQMKACLSAASIASVPELERCAT